MTAQSSIRLNVRSLPVLARDQIQHAQLPAQYEAAKAALIECVRVDEVKEIADKHAAIAHYAKQVKDKSLLHYAERVYLRALARIGELLSEIKDSAARLTLAQSHGLGKSAAQSAIHMARLSRRVRNRLIDNEPPISKTELIGMGHRLAPARLRSRSDGSRYSEWNQTRGPYGKAQYVLDMMIEALEETDGRLHFTGRRLDPGAIARALNAEEAERLSPRLRVLIDWLDEFERCIPKVRR